MSFTDDQLDHGHALGRALADWIGRGARYAVIPERLLQMAAAGAVIDGGWGVLADLAPTRCRAHEPAGSPAVPLWHLCLLDVGHPDDHGWPPAIAGEAFASQMDPIARIARRAAHAAGMSAGVLCSVEVT